MPYAVPSAAVRFRALLAFTAGLILSAGSLHTVPAGRFVAIEQDETVSASSPAKTSRTFLSTLSNAADWHFAGYRGRGLTVAVLDSGFRGWRQYLGNALPADAIAKTFRNDGNFEARDSQHGILCAEVVHALAPEARVVLANWEGSDPDSFLRAVRWAREQGANVITCSVIEPAWGDGEGGGRNHKTLRELLGDGSRAGDMLFFSCAGNTAQRTWSGPYSDDGHGHHNWGSGSIENAVSPWGSERVSIEMVWSNPAAYAIDVIDDTGAVVASGQGRGGNEPGAAVARFDPKAERTYKATVRKLDGPAGAFHLVGLGANLDKATARGSIPFPGDGAEVVTVGAVGLDNDRASYSACGPNSTTPKPDLVAPVPFMSRTRSRPFAGTSAAAPQAAGLATLLWARHPNWTAAHVRRALVESAQDLGPTGHDFETGYGLVRLPVDAPAGAVAGANALR